MFSLPVELYRLIMDQLHPHEDAVTLLSLALSSQTLRYESQSALFRVVFDYTWKSDMNDARNRHVKFLEAIIDSPSRLGPLVYSYSQWRVIPAQGIETYHVLGLMSKALKLMVNLRDLRLSYFNHYNPLEGCTFQLESVQVENLPSSAVSWLSTQNYIRHLDTSMFPVHKISDARCIAPTLQSIKGSRESLYALDPGRNIIAFDCLSRYAIDDEVHDLTGKAASNVKYLRVVGFGAFLALQEKSEPLESVVMLEVLGLIVNSRTDYQIPEAFSQLPHTLRLLVIHESDLRDSHWDWVAMLEIIHPGTDIKVWLARNLFAILPNLHFLDVRSRTGHPMRVKSTRYHRPINQAAEIYITHTIIEGFWKDGDQWWRNHDLELQRLSHQ